MPGIDVARLEPFMRASPLFSHLDAAGARRLARHGRTEIVAAATPVVRQGEDGGVFYLIARGSVRVTVAADGAGAGAEPQEVARLHTGAFFGKLAVLGRRPRSATVETLEETELICFWRAPVLQLLRSYPAARAYLETLEHSRAAEAAGAAGAAADTAVLPLTLGAPPRRP